MKVTHIQETHPLNYQGANESNIENFDSIITNH
jgi:hypothetical protein